MSDQAVDALDEGEHVAPPLRWSPRLVGGAVRCW
jgi:hypothetical protein